MDADDRQREWGSDEVITSLCLQRGERRNCAVMFARDGPTLATCMGMKEGVGVMVHMTELQSACVGQAHNKVK